MTEIQPRLYSRDFAQNKHYYFKMMRESNPVFPGRFSRFRNAWLLTRYEDCLNFFKDGRVVKNPDNVSGKSKSRSNFWVPNSFRPLLLNMLNSDEPDHRRLRNLVHKAFTPRLVGQLQPRIQSVANQLACQLKNRLQEGPIDLVANFAMPFPLTVICEMIGIPSQDRLLVEQMTAKLIAQPTVFNMLRATPAIRKFVRYVHRLANQRRKKPENDLLTALVHAEDEGERLSPDELVGMVFLLVVAGHETTVGLISNSFLALHKFPEQKQILINNLDLMPDAVEEFLRYDGPLATTEIAFAKTDIELHQTVIPKGSLVFQALLSANRDERQFDRPDELDIQRTPNKHLAFGQGIHYCLGAPLARLETDFAFRAILEQLPNMQLAFPEEPVQYKPILIVNRPTALMVKLG